MMSRSGAGIPHSRIASRARRGGLRPPPIGPKRQSDVPTRGRGYHGGTTQRESASRCVSVRACALPNNISSATSPALSSLLSPDGQHASRRPLLSLFLSCFLHVFVATCMRIYIPFSLFRSPSLGFRRGHTSSSHRVAPRRAASLGPPSSVPISDGSLTKTREEKNHAAERHVCCTRADRQARCAYIAIGSHHRRELAACENRFATLD